MSTFFTADTHFGHKRICELSKRPFGSIEEHDEQLIMRWNTMVAPSDVVYHLGDVGLCKKDRFAEILSRLNGEIRLIKGNHDDKNAIDKPGLRERFSWIKDLYLVKEPLRAEYGIPKSNGECETSNKLYIQLCHYPMVYWFNSDHGTWLLHGHCHGSYADPKRLVLDVGVDSWDYAPVKLERVIEAMTVRVLAGATPTEHHEE